MPRLLLLQFLVVFALVPAAGAEGDQAIWKQHFAESADGTRIAYYVAGTLTDGTTPLLVISGGPGSDHRYMRVGRAFAQLSRKRPVVMFDQRGTSRSGDVSEDPQFSRWAEDVDAVRKALNAPKVDVLGHSFGGFVAMSYAGEYPERVRSITFVDSPSPKLSENEQLLSDIYPDRIGQWRETRRSLSPQFPASELSAFFSMEFVDPEKASAYLQSVSDYVYRIDVNNALRQQLSTLDFQPILKGLELPVLIVHGRFDAVIAPSVAWKVHKLIRGSRIVFIEKAGHLPFVERPDAFVQAVGTFLDEVDGRTPSR